MIDLRANPFFLDDEGVRWVEETREGLTAEDKMQQLFFPIGYSANEGYLQYELLNRRPGGVMFRSGKTEELFSAYTYLQEHTKIPMLLAANLEAGGDGIVEEGTAFGKQMQAAATGDPEQAYRLGKISCAELPQPDYQRPHIRQRSGNGEEIRPCLHARGEGMRQRRIHKTLPRGRRRRD